MIYKNKPKKMDLLVSMPVNTNNDQKFEVNDQNLEAVSVLLKYFWGRV